MMKKLITYNKDIALTYSALNYKNLLFELGPSISTGSEALDSLLDNGVEPLKLYMLYGPAGSGKTILLHQIAVSAVLNTTKALFIERGHSFNPNLITNIAKRFGVSNVTKHILYKRVRYPGEFEVLLNKILSEVDFNILLIDNFDQFIKLYLNENLTDPGLTYTITRQLLLRLHYVKEIKKIPIVITNRVYSNIRELIAHSYIPYGGIALRSMVNKAIHLMKENKFIRAVDVYSNKPSAILMISEDGVHDI